MSCHQDVYDQWRTSHHALANRTMTATNFAEAFEPPHQHQEGGPVSEIYKTEDGRLIIETLGPDDTIEPFEPEMVLAYDPLIQFLIPFPGGRWQVTELAWDIHNKEWFNVYGYQNRRPEEWGHWSQRGMNWNTQCAECHTSNYAKNYDHVTDAFATTWDQMGISCQQCHGEMEAHLENPVAALIPEEQAVQEAYFDNCITCHSRRENFSGDFKPGDKYFDHFRVQLPVMDQFYHADGQIKDEVFVYGSLAMSRMHHAGVKCLDCHNPHTNEMILPIDNNSLCLSCHQGVGVNGAPPIEPLTHSNHGAGSTGNRCVECHMTFTTYMMRDPRRDHGFHMPDPKLTIELGIPNACNKCHTEETAEWAMEHYDTWYGESDKIALNRLRARTLSAAYAGDLESIDGLRTLLEQEIIPLWKATYLQLIMTLEPSPENMQLARSYFEDESPLVRNVVVQTLGIYPENHTFIRPALDDESRLVRIDAAWHLRASIDQNSRAWQELFEYMYYASDQPAGAMRLADYHMGVGDLPEAERWLTKASNWDKTSPMVWMSRGMLSNSMGKNEEALGHLKRAQGLTTEDPMPSYYISLLLAEMGRPGEAQLELEKLVVNHSDFDRAWYNLGLLYSQQNQPEEAIRRLDKAIELNPLQPDYPYAKATILIRMGAIPETLEILQSILEVYPNYAPAAQLYQRLMQQTILPNNEQN